MGERLDYINEKYGRYVIANYQSMGHKIDSLMFDITNNYSAML